MKEFKYVVTDPEGIHARPAGILVKTSKGQNCLTVRDHKCQHRLLYSAKLLITIDGENKIFQDKSKFKHYLSINPTLQKILEEKLQPKKDNSIHEKCRK